MKICVIGLGYVGLASVACLADLGHQIYGVESSPEKLALLQKSKISFSEPGLDDLFVKVRANVHLYLDIFAVPDDIEVYMVCVGTPGGQDGNLDLRDVFAVKNDILKRIAKSSLKKSAYICFRSTFPLGTCEKIYAEIEMFFNASEYQPIVVYNPEFLREGKAINDFKNPQVVVIGSSQNIDKNFFGKIYLESEDKLFFTGLREAEIIKSVNNTWHALKVCFANEIALICDKSGAKTAEVFKMFHADKSLNISSAYLNPGFAFGGSCLKKDVAALDSFAKTHTLNLPVIANINNSNESFIETSVDDLLKKGSRRISIIGLSFKEDTDDFRNSTRLKFCEILLARGTEIKVHDPVIVKSLFESRYSINDLISRSSVFNYLESSFESVCLGAELIVTFSVTSNDIQRIRNINPSATLVSY
jgi:GDP-mannose 6-dehydrogenase